MADIVERLRKHVNDRGGPSIENGAWQMMLEAATGIEYLKTANQILNDLMDKRDDEITDLRATISTLESNARAQAKLLADTGRERDGLRKAISDIQRAAVEGRVCDDVAWFDGITTLYDFCDLTLNRLGTAALPLSPASTGGADGR